MLQCRTKDSMCNRVQQNWHSSVHGCVCMVKPTGLFSMSLVGPEQTSKVQVIPVCSLCIQKGVERQGLRAPALPLDFTWTVVLTREPQLPLDIFQRLQGWVFFFFLFFFQEPFWTWLKSRGHLVLDFRLQILLLLENRAIKDKNMWPNKCVCWVVWVVFVYRYAVSSHLSYSLSSPVCLCLHLSFPWRTNRIWSCKRH